MQTVEITHEFEGDKEDGQPIPASWVFLLTMKRHCAESPWHVVAAEIEAVTLLPNDGAGTEPLDIDGPITLTPKHPLAKPCVVLADYVENCLWDKYGDELTEKANRQWERDCE